MLNVKRRRLSRVFAGKSEESVNDFLFILKQLIAALCRSVGDGLSPEAQGVAESGLVLSASRNQRILWLFSHSDGQHNIAFARLQKFTLRVIILCLQWFCTVSMCNISLT